MRIAFITTEFVTEYPDGGGLGNYLNRMTKTLRTLGHEPVVFVLSDHPAGRIEHEGVVVHRVARADRHLAIRAAYRIARGMRVRRLGPAIRILSGAIGLGRALREMERVNKFDFVQSSDYLASGLAMDKTNRRPHIVRCSCPSDLYALADQRVQERYWEVTLERALLRRADAVYAPSRFVADHYSRTLGLDVGVVRPPIITEVVPGEMPVGLPERYLLHFGQLTSRKGTDWLSRALPLAWAEEPGLKLVFAGQASPIDRAEWESRWGDHCGKVLWVGRQRKPELYAILQGSEAAILPSLVDNLPNTVIESLMFGIPVLGSAGASIDELVEPGVTGDLIPINDAPALAVAMVRCWRSQSPARKGFTWRSAINHEMTPQAAAENLLKFASLNRSWSSSHSAKKPTNSEARPLA